MAKDNNKGFMKGALLGGLVAGIGALLFAPKSGKETRDDIAKTAKKVKTEVADDVAKAEAELKEQMNNLKRIAGELKGEAATDAKALVKKAEALRADLKVAAGNIADASADMRDEVADNARALVKSTGEVVKEAQTMSTKLAGSARTKVKAAAKKS